MRISIVSESEIEKEAKLLSDRLKNIKTNIKTEIAISTVESFPLGDAMLRFIFKIASRNDYAFVLISNSDSSLRWITKELKIQQSCLESCLNVYPVFLSASIIPDYWLAADNLFFVLDSNICQQIKHWLISIR